MYYFIVVVATLAGLGFHAWLYMLVRQWMDRDLALSLAGGDPHMQAYMLQRLQHARQLKMGRKARVQWLAQEAAAYSR
ncbi:hypothetical protein [Pseudomonas fulva]|uniref:hypothetical protein n=1 Tax=Pseudomonas fulva TaxID=47880 RepID=UPI000D8FC337|nr:hypothetical protein [Pseudomonas fulva]PYB85014.1 hypothetical protein DMX01_20350 [Pseudomonas fulva]PYC11367.1 hypothetical protein DMX00_17675 [Pseudomonas fulva]